MLQVTSLTTKGKLNLTLGLGQGSRSGPVPYLPTRWRCGHFSRLVCSQLMNEWKWGISAVIYTNQVSILNLWSNVKAHSMVVDLCPQFLKPCLIIHFYSLAFEPAWDHSYFSALLILSLIYVFMLYSTLFQMWSYLKCFINKAELRMRIITIFIQN